MKWIVLYKSNTGFTKKYAEWISGELNCDIKSIDEFDFNSVKNYDGLIFGGFLHARGISGLKKVKGIFSQFNHNNIILFASGASPESEDVLKVIRQSNLSADEKDINVFYFHGGYDHNKVKGLDKFVMNLMRIGLEHKKKKGSTLTYDQDGMLGLFDNPMDFTDKEKIKDLVGLAKSIEQGGDL
ncbi:MAG: flavodoxin domain-containing protein [Clostridiaceae bacterium]